MPSGWTCQEMAWHLDCEPVATHCQVFPASTPVFAALRARLTGLSLGVSEASEQSGETEEGVCLSALLSLAFGERAPCRCS